MNHCLMAKEVAKEFKSPDALIQILEGVTVEFAQGTSYAIMGVSGVGKSTFMHMLAGLDHPSRGAIFFDGIDIASLSESARTNYLQTGVGLVFQTPYLIRELSVLENVMLPGMVSGQDESICTARAHELLESVGLKNKITSKPGTLSIGQQQRVALCRALFNKPAFLLADEPTGALDEKTGRAIVDLLLDLQATLQMGLVISTHDQYVAQAMNVIYEIEGGKMVSRNFGINGRKQ